MIFTASLAFLALTCALAVLVAQGGRFSAKLDLLTHFAPVYFFVGLAVAAAGLALGRLGLIWVVIPGLVASFGAAALMAPEYVERVFRAPLSDGSRLVVVQFNAWGGNARPNEAVSWILAQKPDIVVLEEAGVIGPRLAKAGAFHVVCPQGYAVIYSKLPLVSTNCPSDPGAERVLISRAEVMDGLGAFTIIGIHRPWPIRFARDREQTAELKQLVRATGPDRTLLIGDFNSTPWSFARKREDAELGLIRRTRALGTWPADRVSHNHVPAPFPAFPIDHVYAGPEWRTVEVRRGPRLGSDHYPVVVVLTPARTFGARGG